MRAENILCQIQKFHSIYSFFDVTRFMEIIVEITLLSVGFNLNAAPASASHQPSQAGILPQLHIKWQGLSTRARRDTLQ